MRFWAKGLSSLRFACRKDFCGIPAFCVNRRASRSVLVWWNYRVTETVSDCRLQIADWGQACSGTPALRGPIVQNKPNFGRRFKCKVSSVKSARLHVESPVSSCFKLYTSNSRRNADCPPAIVRNKANWRWPVVQTNPICRGPSCDIASMPRFGKQTQFQDAAK